MFSNHWQLVCHYAKIYEMRELLDSCPICESKRILFLWNSEDALHNSWRYDRCLDCGDIFLNPLPDEDQILKFYDENYYGVGHKRFKGIFEAMVVLFRHARARRAVKAIPRGGSVLDVGCGRGIFLEILSRRGYKCLGAELSELSGRDASKHVQVLTGDFMKFSLPEESFDLVTFWQVIEHIRDPKAAFIELSRIIKTGGKLLIQAPNPESAQARIAGPYWFHLDPPRHIHSMPLKCLDGMAASAGFVREKYTTLNFEYSPFGILQSLYNVMGVNRDAFYNSMMSSKENSNSIAALKKAALWAASFLLTPVSIPLSLVEWFMGYGGIIEVVYRKSGTP